MLEIKRISVVDYFDSARELAAQHWQETEPGFSDCSPEINLDAYRALESAGVVIAFGAFSDGILVGYVAGYVTRHMHYLMLVGQHDMLFLHKEYRKGRIGLRLMQEFEQAAKSAGAERILWHAKPGSAFESILKRMNCKTEEVIYIKEC